MCWTVRPFPRLDRLHYMVSRRSCVSVIDAICRAVHPALRPVTRLSAVVGIAISFHFILFSLTFVCAIPAGSSQYAQATVSLVRFNEALEKYRLDCGEYPASRIGLEALKTNPGAEGWNGPYLIGSLRDPWNRPFLYEVSRNAPLVRSLGADGKPGGDLFDADLSSQAPWASVPESSFHATRAFFNRWVAPWVLLLGSVYALTRPRSRTAAPSA